MTSAARSSRTARHVAAALAKNPDLTPQQAANAARLTIRAEMMLLARKSAAARAARKAASSGPVADLDPVITDAPQPPRPGTA
jgi:hypothetical protein